MAFLDAAEAAALLLTAAWLALSLAGLGSQPVLAAGFEVKTTADAEDVNPGDGICQSAAGTCTLRAAVQEANALAGTDTTTGTAETQPVLTYFNGSAWVPVKSTGGVAPGKNDNLDGTISGGRFTVTFDMTSTPKVTELNGTPFGDGSDSVAPVLDGVPTDLTVEAADRGGCGNLVCSDSN